MTVNQEIVREGVTQWIEHFKKNNNFVKKKGSEGESLSRKTILEISRTLFFMSFKRVKARTVM
jgi:hypothetical protein